MSAWNLHGLLRVSHLSWFLTKIINSIKITHYLNQKATEYRVKKDLVMKWYQMRWAQKYWGKEARERYRRYLQSGTWKTKRKAVLQAARFRCRRCGSPATEVHHETYKRIYNERLSDLTALCSKCHEAAHTQTPKSRKKSPPAERHGSQKPKQRRFYRKRKATTKGGIKKSTRGKYV